MDLVYEAKQTERVYRNSQRLDELKLLRKWDLQGRVATVEFAVTNVCSSLRT